MNDRDNHDDIPGNPDPLGVNLAHLAHATALADAHLKALYAILHEHGDNAFPPAAQLALHVAAIAANLTSDFDVDDACALAATRHIQQIIRAVLDAHKTPGHGN